MQYPLAVWRQYYLPQHALTRFAGLVSHCQIPWLKNWIIRDFIARYGVDMHEALESDPRAYASFHDFFTRHLKPSLRPIDHHPEAICSPCDGTISQIGKIEEGMLLQAKGHHFSLEALLANSHDAKNFTNGHFATIYLAPKDYHRVHMPYCGSLQRLRYVPGKLFSVNPLTTQYVEGLFARNERVITLFKHPAGDFAVILVGAMLVGSMSTRWGGYLTPHRGKDITQVDYPDTSDQHIKLDKGDEMGYFSLGSTVILLFAENMRWENAFTQQTRIVVGQRIGQFLK